ncbi:MAG: SIS domain-containing protein [Burkholderiaceae bacterium]
MLIEARSAPEAVAFQLASDHSAYEAFAASLRTQPPKGIVTLARGSSDHAAHYFAYLAMARSGALVTSLPMSLVTLYNSRIAHEGLVSLAFSQSGQSPDLIAPTTALRTGGARTAAFVNAPGSPLAQAAEHAFDLRAGAERSIAATKSYIAQLVAGARLVALWQQDGDLITGLQQLPLVLERALDVRWDMAIDALLRTDRLLVIGRGTGLPIALEAALKFKETCGIQAEAFSGAEVQHGPMALVHEGYPVLIFAPRGPAQAGLLELAESLHGRGAHVMVVAPVGTPRFSQFSWLPLTCAPHEDLDPIAAIQIFYIMVEALARARGKNPDQPPHLAKVTKTH